MFVATIARAAGLALALPVLLATAGAAPAPLGPVVRVTAQSLKSALGAGSAMRTALVGGAWTAPGKPIPAYSAPSGASPVAELPIDLGPMLGSQSETAASLAKPDKAKECSDGTIAPQISAAKGKLTSGGYLVVTGSCFGTSGSVIVAGVFPGGTLPVTIVAWSPTAITAQLPVVTGVPNSIMAIHVKRTLASKPFLANFTAAIGPPLPLLTGMTMNVCGGDVSVCEVDAPHPAVGVHADMSAQSGSDVWTVKVPAPWTLASITLVQIAAGPVGGSVITSSPGSTTFKVVWAELPNAFTTKTVTTQSTSSSGGSWDSIFSDIVTGGAAAAVNNGSSTATNTTTVAVPVYTEGYRIEVNVTGPLGMIPPV